ncbi:hypothetical protein AVEN_195415-1 [Araneus ventricosus]|uniref:Uncharacterized protein n=1 Tax=Araneus ventricosus TaxID=182803 RepID=A0A4Y2K6R2_ARAVE|nr:hypothetical protein AVEN_195415-1 [Araneus ventricosus]
MYTFKAQKVSGNKLYGGMKLRYQYLVVLVENTVRHPPDIIKGTRKNPTRVIGVYSGTPGWVGRRHFFRWLPPEKVKVSQPNLGYLYRPHDLSICVNRYCGPLSCHRCQTKCTLIPSVNRNFYLPLDALFLEQNDALHCHI